MPALPKLIGDWSTTLSDDKGWNRPYITDEKLVPERFKVILSSIIEKRLICASGGNVFVFIPIFNSWFMICSYSAIVFFNSVMGMESASVRYVDAFKPYITFIEMNAMDNVAERIPTSICIGTSRIRVSRDRDSLNLTQCEPILRLTSTSDSYNKVASLCYMPLAIRGWPSRWDRTTPYSMYKFIRPLFQDERELLTLEWVIGNGLLDPSKFSKALILFGEGGTGKSTLLAALNIALMGCCGSIPDRALLNIRNSDAEAINHIIVSNRFVTAGDVGGLEDSTNLPVIKTITGHDYVSIPPLRARSACSLFYATNRLDDPMVNEEWKTTQIMRRVVVIPMDTNAEDVFEEDMIPQDHISRLDFVLRCVHTKLTYPSMPVSPYSLICTLAGSRYDEIAQWITEKDNTVISEDEHAMVSSMFGGILGISINEVADLARKISSSCVISIKGKYYLSNIAPSEEFYETFKL